MNNKHMLGNKDGQKSESLTVTGSRLQSLTIWIAKSFCRWWIRVTQKDVEYIYSKSFMACRMNKFSKLDSGPIWNIQIEFLFSYEKKSNSLFKRLRSEIIYQSRCQLLHTPAVQYILLKLL